MKSIFKVNNVNRFVVALYMGAWIEILMLSMISATFTVALYMGAWIEIITASALPIAS